MSNPQQNPAYSDSVKVSFWRDPTKRSMVFQALALFVAASAGYYLFYNTQANLARQNIATGFGFFKQSANFEIGESMIAYSAADTYFKALVVGVLNTLKVSFIGIVLTVFMGTFMGIARLSKNWLVSKIAAVFIEVLQNIPILIQLFFWYTIFYSYFPMPRQALSPFEGIYLTNRGLTFAVPASNPTYTAMAIALAVALGFGFLIRRWARKRKEDMGREFPYVKAFFGLIIGLPLVVWLLGGMPIVFDVPELRGFNFVGGMTASPEFAALLVGLVLYTSAFVAEIVRAGIQSVSKGQIEAAQSIGLKPAKVLNLVILPMASRVILPPLTSQLLTLTKNSSLAVAIGYPDIVSIANTTMNQTGQAIEGVALIMVVYLFFSLSTSAILNWYNKSIALVGTKR